MVVSSTINEVKESSSFDRNGCSKGIFQVEHEDSKGIFSELLRRMNPGACLGACGGEVDLTQSVTSPTVSGSKLRSLVPDLMEAIDFENSEMEPNTMYKKRRRNLALKSLYELASDKQNRIPLACTQKYNVIPILSKCLIGRSSNNDISTVDYFNESDETRRLTCLILNQLSLPYQNKKIMVFGDDSNVLIENLLHVINLRLPETYLCCICLMNLTYLEAAIGPILNLSIHRVNDENQQRVSRSNRPNNIDPKQWNDFPYASRVPTSRFPTPMKQRYISGGSSFSIPCLEDPQSLIRSTEKLMYDNRPFLMSKILSVEGEAVRWSVGLMRNLTKKEVHCSIIAKTQIPYMILSFITQSPHPLIRWKKDSLEKMSLEVVSNMAQFEETKAILLAADAIEMLKHIEDERERLGLQLNTSYILKVLYS